MRETCLFARAAALAEIALGDECVYCLFTADALGVLNHPAEQNGRGIPLNCGPDIDLAYAVGKERLYLICGDGGSAVQHYLLADNPLYFSCCVAVILKILTGGAMLGTEVADNKVNARLANKAVGVLGGGN